jgi:phosphoribosylformimino-5-aminoimidazole carboxamide ribotide isomerase
VDSILYTDIGRDGMLTGVNAEATLKLAQSVSVPVIASGGIANMNDIDTLCTLEQDGVTAAILGRSLYEGHIDFKKAQERADTLSAKT